MTNETENAAANTAETTGTMLAKVAEADALPTAGEPPVHWPDDWRERMTDGDAKALKTARRFADPSALWKAYRELRERFDGGGLVRLPTAGADDEDRQALHRALGVPERPEDYFELIDLPVGEVLGEADRPVAEDFARAVHSAGATPEVMSAAIDWYLTHQEAQLAAIDEADERDRAEGKRTIRATWGPAETRMINAIGALFANTPGGTDLEGGGLYARLMGGRTGDGRLIGNDPQVLAFLGALAQRVNPHVTVTGAGHERAGDIGARIREIEAMMQTNDPAYWKDDAVQAEYRELIEARSALARR